MNFYEIGIIVFGLSVLVSLGILKFFPVFGCLDNPKKYGHARDAVPYSAGLPLVFLFVILNLVFLDFTWQLLVLNLVLLLLGIVSFYDDRKGIKPIWRLLIQVVLAGVIVLTGVQVLEITNPLGGDNLKLLWISPFLSIFWIVLLTNLLNFLDGVSGMTSGVSAIGFWVVFGLSIWPGMHSLDQTSVSVMALLMAIIATVSAVMEFPSPKFLIGDSGTMFFGFMLGVLTLINGAKLATVALVLLIPILDGILVMFKRLLDGKKPWQGDLSHAHHRLLRMGFSKRKLLLLYYLMTALFGLIALFSWNTFFKVTSLLVLGSGFVIFINYLWIQEKK